MILSNFKGKKVVVFTPLYIYSGILLEERGGILLDKFSLILELKPDSTKNFDSEGVLGEKVFISKYNVQAVCEYLK